MRKINIFFILTLFSIVSYGQTDYYYSRTANGLWSNPSPGGVWYDTDVGGNAVPVGEYPGKQDYAYIYSGNTIHLDVNITDNAGIYGVTVYSGGTLTSEDASTLNIASGKAFHIYGDATMGCVTFKNGAEINIYDGGTFTTVTCCDMQSGSIIAVNGGVYLDGTLNLDGDITGDGSIEIASTATISSATGTIYGLPASTINPGETISGYTWDGGTSGSGTVWSTATNWSQDNAPTSSTHDVVIPSGLSEYPIISSTGNECRSIIIENGAVLTIASGGDLTVVEDITNNAGNTGLIIESTSASLTGSLKISSGTPNATVQRYITQNEWHLVAPVTEPSTANDFYLGAPNLSWLAEYNETTNVYDYITDENASLSRAKGYSYWVLDGQGDQTIYFTGTLISADVDALVTKNGAGWNLIGNPFPSAIDWSTVSNVGNTTGIAYVWDNSSGGYLYSTGGTDGVGNIPGDIIPLGQGFLVEATGTGGSIIIPAAAKVHSTANFIKSVDEKEPNQFIRVDLDDGYYGNTVFVGFPENGTDNFDIGGDATKLYSSTQNIQFFAIENIHELCINANTPLTEGESRTVPLNLVQVTDDDYALTFSDLDQLENVSITLEDNKTGNTQDIRENPVYSFSASNNDNAQRFLLHFVWTPNDIDEDTEDASSNIQIYAYGNEVYIRSTNNTNYQNGIVTIYDLMGRELVLQRIVGAELIKLPVNITNNYVVVKVVKDDSIKVQKVFIR